MTQFDWPTIVARFDEVLARGLCIGVGERNGQMCIEAAICAALDLPHGDDPACVTRSVRSFKIALNDAQWSSPQARATGLRALGIAQIGSRDVVDDQEFSLRLAEKTIRHLIPRLFREIAPNNEAMMAAADRCEREGSKEAAGAAARAAEAAWATRAAAEAAAWAAEAAWAAWAAAEAAEAARAAEAAARAAAEAAARAASTDVYLLLSAALALETLRELGSPGCAWLDAESAAGNKETK